MSNFISFGDTARLLEVWSHHLRIFRSLAPQKPTFLEKLSVSSLLSRRCVQRRPSRTSFLGCIGPSDPTIFGIRNQMYSTHCPQSNRVVKQLVSHPLINPTDLFRSGSHLERTLRSPITLQKSKYFKTRRRGTN